MDINYSNAWALAPDRLQMVLDVASRQAEYQAKAAQAGLTLPGTYTVEYRGDAAILPVRGILTRRETLLTTLLRALVGASSIEVLAQDFRAAIDDPAIRRVILNFDTPGGEMAGVSEFAQHVFAARSRKPIIAYAGDTAASGGYWIAAAASEVVTSLTGILGGIGIVATVRNDKDPKRFEIVSSHAPRKRPDVTTEAGRQVYQEHVDALEEVFLKALVQYRGVTPAKVAADFGKGGLLVGKDAVRAGLADRVGTLWELLARAA